MKNISRQDRYLYEQVETVLRDSIPNISKNICENFKTKPTGGFKQFLDRASLFAQEKGYALGASFLKRMQSAGNRETTRRMEDHERRINSVIARELGMKDTEMKGILDTPKNPPIAPFLGTPNFAEMHKIYRSKLQTWQEREALVKKMNQVRRDNPFIKSADTTANAEERRSRIGNVQLGRHAIPDLEARSQKARQERINRGYTT